MMRNNIGPESCRVCLRKCKKSHSIYVYFEEGEETPCTMLEQITGLNLESEEVMKNTPQVICRRCELSLNMAYEFRNKALKSQNIIENYQRNRNQSLSIVHKKNEASDECWELTDYDDHEELELDESDSKTSTGIVLETKLEIESLDLPMENESEGEFLDEVFLDSEESPTFKGSIHSSDDSDDTKSMERLNSTTEDFDIYLRDEEQQRQKEEEGEEVYIEVKAEKRDDDDLELEQSTYDVTKLSHKKMTGKENKNLTKRERKPRAYKPRINKGATAKSRTRVKERHVCDICGNIYEHRGRMLEHRRRHNKTLTFECEICGKSFNLRENMRKHMMTHRGGKPYQCSFCSRTFFYESVKKSHEAIHAGFKPYVCKECNKAFAYAHALKKHEMIHNEVKLFHCSYCNKDFRLQHHMKQHEQTKLHQNALYKHMGRQEDNAQEQQEEEALLLHQSEIPQIFEDHFEAI